MNFLSHLDERFPITPIGIASGAGAWILDHTTQITGMAGMVGATCTAALATIALGAKLFCLALRAVRRLRVILRNRAQRLDFERDRLP